MEGSKDKATKMKNRSPGGALEESAVLQKGIRGFRAQALLQVHNPWVRTLEDGAQVLRKRQKAPKGDGENPPPAGTAEGIGRRTEACMATIDKHVVWSG